MSDELRLALFLDFENLILGAQEAKYKTFDIDAVSSRLLEKGRIIVKRAYADWNRYGEYRARLHGHAIELIEVPQKRIGGKNSADIRLVVDALDLCYSKEHLNVFVLGSGDSDFSPLASKLKENDKQVIGLGVKQSTSNLMVDNCDEFIFYDDLVRTSERTPELPTSMPAQKREAFTLMLESISALVRENKDTLWGSMVKQTMQRKRPSFNEGYYGYHTFSQLLEDAQERGLITIEKDERSGTYVVTEFEPGAPRRPRRRKSRPKNSSSNGGR